MKKLLRLYTMVLDRVTGIQQMYIERDERSCNEHGGALSRNVCACFQLGIFKQAPYAD